MQEFKVIVQLHGETQLTTTIKAESQEDARSSINMKSHGNLYNIGDLLVPAPNIMSIEIISNNEKLREIGEFGFENGPLNIRINKSEAEFSLDVTFNDDKTVCSFSVGTQHGIDEIVSDAIEKLERPQPRGSNYF